MWNTRHALIASHCAWCGQIWTGKAWLQERRPAGRETYAQGICPPCAALHFAAGADRTRLSVEQFQMRPKAALAVTGGIDD